MKNKNQFTAILITTISLLFFVSCASTPPYDRGVFNPKNEPEETFCTLLIHSLISVQYIDGISVNYRNIDNDAGVNLDEQTVTLPAGYHEFVAYFKSGTAWSRNILVAGELEAGKSYFLDYHMHTGILSSNLSIEFVIEDKERGKEIQLSEKELKKRKEESQQENNQSI